MYKRIDWEVTLDGETFSGSMNLHKHADLDTVMDEIKDEIAGEIEERAEDE